MRHRPLVLAPALLALAAARPAAAQGDFQGVITVQMHGEDGAARDAKFYVKGDKVRMESEAPNGMGTFAMITDRGARKSWTLMGQRQMYMESDLDSAGMPARMGQLPPRPQPTITWTGKSETIAGMKCEDATATEGDGPTYDMCIAKGIPFFMGGGMRGGMGRGGAGGGGGMGRGAGGPSADWARAAGGGFPLRVQKRGDAAPVLLVTNVERTSVADDQFAPPAGWQKMTMPMGMGGGRP